MVVANILFDDRMGGPQKRVIEVAGRLLAATGIETFLVLPEGKGTAEAVAKRAGLRVCRLRGRFLPSLERPVTLLRWALHFLPVTARFHRLFSREEVDLVHVNGGFFLQPALAARLSGTRLVWHLNDTLLRPWLARLVGRVVRTLAHRVVVAAEAVALHHGIPRDEVAVLYAPVDPDAFHADRLAERRDGEDVFTVGMLGHWNPLKGHDLFVESLRRVRDEHGKEVRGVMGGRRLETQARYARRIDAMIEEYGLSGSLEDVDFVEHVPVFMAELDAFVLSSRSEACPMVVLEAMAAGIPVVATDVGGVRELLLEGSAPPAGIVVHRDDASAIAEALVRLLEDSDLRVRLSSAGPPRVRERFSLAACAEAHGRVYRSLVGRGGPLSPASSA